MSKADPTSLHLPRLKRMTKRYSFRAFYITTCLISAFAIFSLVLHRTANYRHGYGYTDSQRRAAAALDVHRLLKRDEECRLVRYADDKCAFIRANCPDEEAGLISYLSLYYCGLSKAQPLAFIILIVWLSVLFSTIGIAASDFFCINLSTIASILGMSESLAGVTFLAFGNGSPDVFSTFAAMSSNSGSLAVGELIGAAGFITAVVAGSMALAREFKVGKKSFVRDIGFFIVAVSFSMVFLSDGSLHVWECIVMIAFYIFYVVTVVVWHWFLTRRQKQRDRLAAALGHQYNANDAEIEVQEAYHDDEAAPSTPNPQVSRQSTGDWHTLESGHVTPAIEDDSDNEGPQGVRLATEMSNSMRVLNPSGRKNTLNTIRPSLVGAMEFRAVLSSLQKSSLRPIHMRRYSDDLASSAPHSGGPVSPYLADHETASRIIITEPDDDHVTNEQGLHRPSQLPDNRRVTTSNLLTRKGLHPAAYTVADVPSIGVIGATPTFPPTHLLMPPLNTGRPSIASNASTGGNKQRDSSDVVPSSPTISLSASEPEDEPAAVLNDLKVSSSSQNKHHLAPPAPQHRGRPSSRSTLPGDPPGSPSSGISPMTTPPMRPTLSIPTTNRHHDSPIASPTQDFPAYTDNFVESPVDNDRRLSILTLPEPHLASTHTYTNDMFEHGATTRIVRWWPYNWLPDPYVMMATCFPTLVTWRDKGIMDKFISIVSTPSIFLLAITLPVVETESEQNDDDSAAASIAEPNGPATGLSSHHRSKSMSGTPALDENGEWRRYRRATLLQRSRSNSRSPSPSPGAHGLTGHANAADLAIYTEQHQQHHSHRHTHSHNNHHQENHHPHEHQSPTYLHPPGSPAFPFPDNFKFPLETNSDRCDTPKDPAPDAHSWNRWLVIIQLFTAPFFILLIIWANTEPSDPTTDPHNLTLLARLAVYSTIASVIATVILVLTTSAYQPPRRRFLLCFLGFLVSIAWISTIANEVVGILKALGIILGISDAILGLTIFAVGNSLGDLVANITVARLGYPVMALSACFGGPMLNILIGIGVSGLWMTVSEARHKHAKHPSKHIRYKPYEIEVSHTLMISACALLVTLVGLLVVVPLNGWCMNRRIGIGLIVLWAVSVVINLTVEITGVL